MRYNTFYYMQQSSPFLTQINNHYNNMFVGSSTPMHRSNVTLLHIGWAQQVRFRGSPGRVRNQRAALRKEQELARQAKAARWEAHLQRMQDQEKEALERSIERQRKHREITNQAKSAKL